MSTPTTRTGFGIRLTPIRREGASPRHETGHYRLEISPNDTVPAPLLQLLPVGLVLRVNGERFVVVTQELDLGAIESGPTGHVLAYIVRSLTNSDAPRGSHATYPNPRY